MNQVEPYLSLLRQQIRDLDLWRMGYRESSEPVAELPDMLLMDEVLGRLTEKLKGNYPFHHPRYAGQMLKPPHPVAWLAYTIAMSINPNNHALDGGPPTSQMEKECVDRLAAMIGFSRPFLGHLTSGGTIANLEALFVARELHPDKWIAASANAHYTHARMSKLLNIPFLEIPTDPLGRPNHQFIRDHASQIGTLVVTLGTTGTGAVEPLADLLPLCREFGIRIHADAAYGGFFKLLEKELPSKAHWEQIQACDSVVIDPHKHGLQPYGCGSILFKDPSVGRFFKHDSPYTYFTSRELHLGEISMECSRAGASAAALWATMELLPLTSAGLGSILHSALKASRLFAGRISAERGYTLFTEPELDIVTWYREPASKSLSSLNEINEQLFQRGMELNEDGFFLSLFSVPADTFLTLFPGYTADREKVTILRSVFMKQEHEAWAEKLAERIFSVAGNAPLRPLA